ncbi:hypothetical protein BUALT_Bualt12G0006400 [Buddleja alternifolia]|uniref:PPM-type phosphatase domain-containing protein n=1 Tax=Buddleja alternifolia TaxID=168488 RepID=A0AAV6WSH5_9LAMI|nr:hypothetical protein BUALT_Bualt12G0006400 [Buddleja alternifolia]
MRNHNSRMHKQRPLECPICLNSMRTPAEKEDHVLQHQQTVNVHELEMDDDPLIWSSDLSQHFNGEFSVAVAQANEPLYDYSQVDTGRHCTFVGIDDSHGGPCTSKYISNKLCQHLQEIAIKKGGISEDVIRNAFSSTEIIGSSCLIGVICDDTLYVANLGDSRAVMGCLQKSDKIVAVQLTREQNAKEQGQLKKKQSVCVSAQPELTRRNLRPKMKFSIFASDGLWELLSNQEAVEIVHKNPRLGIAKQLLMMAMIKASEKGKTPYNDIKQLPAGEGQRRKVHDDITIVVIYHDAEVPTPPQVSVRGFSDTVPSDFDI